jgi:ubiquinone/menaquinone biosynthesis C-methylase UbiE
MKEDPVHKFYSGVAVSGTPESYAKSVAISSGYTEEDLALIPPEARLGLGCGNSVAASGVKPGEYVLDLGCGAGMDLFFAGQKVGPTGKAIGVDFSADMVKRGQQIAKLYKRMNVEFHHGPIESLPFPDELFDLAISNCVLNLVPDKQAAFKEIYRVLRSKGGRFAVSDIVLKKALPEELAKDLGAICGCIGRAVDAETYKKSLEIAGFVNVVVEDSKKNLYKMYFSKEQGGVFTPCCSGGGCCCKGGQPSVFEKYNIDDYAMSCIVKADKK